jgi:hypothetical protein
VCQEAIKGRRDSSNAILDEAKTLVQVIIVCANHSHHNVRVASDIFCYGMYYQICAMVQGRLEVRRAKGVIDSQDTVSCFRHGRDMSNVGDF